jgi:predicted phage tail protein
MNAPIKINFHGELGEVIGKKTWKLHVKSAAEALHAVNVQTEDSVREYFLREDKRHAKYRVLIDGKDVEFNGDLRNNELNIERDNLKELDIIPVLEGSGFFDSAWGGIILGVVGLSFANNPFSIMASLSLITQGLANMLAKPPPMPEARQMTNPNSDPAALANSYLFNGPVNVINEGGPVPLGYGRLTVGSQVIMASYGIKNILVRNAGKL